MDSERPERYFAGYVLNSLAQKVQQSAKSRITGWNLWKVVWESSGLGWSEKRRFLKYEIWPYYPPLVNLTLRGFLIIVVIVFSPIHLFSAIH